VACAAYAFIADRPHHFGNAVNYARPQVSRWSGAEFDPAAVEVLLCLPAEVLVPREMRTAAP
jgi:HD-GYP domain-containing protein (c-di-GMP phosphodiesterase class II)